MKNLTISATATAIILLATPALSASQMIPMCDWTGTSEGEAAMDLIDRLNLRVKPGISATRSLGGCFKIEYVEDGMFVTEYYNPETTTRLQ